MRDYSGFDLDQLVPERPQGPHLRCFGQCQPPEKIAEVVGQGKSGKKRQCSFLNSFAYQANYPGPKLKHAGNLLTYQSNARLFSIPAVKCSKVRNFRFTIFENEIGSL